MILLLALARGGDLRPVHPGDTVEALAVELGDPDLAPQIRALNGLAPGAQPRLGTLLTLPTIVGPDQADQDPFVLSLRGRATLDGAPVALHDAVPVGSRFCTVGDSYATLRVATRCTLDGDGHDDITLSADTCVLVVAAHGTAHSRSTVARVLSGSLQVQPHVGGHGHVSVQAGTGLTTGAEGGYRVTLESAAMRTEALYADVAVQGAGEEVALTAGQGSRVATNQAPSAPVDLVPPGVPLTPEEAAALRRALFTWSPAPDAFGYRFEVATSRDFVDLVYQDDVPDPSHRPSLLMLPWPADGVLYWRIATFDRFGFLGIPSEARSMTLPTSPG